MLFLDRNVDEKRVFVNIETRSSKEITTTPAHLLLVVRGSVQNASIDDVEITFAEHVRVGDRLLVRTNSNFSSNSSKLELEEVVRVDAKLLVGVFAPLTVEGTIVVDDIVASCYAVINSQTIANFAFAPVRFLTHVKQLWFDLMTFTGWVTEESVVKAKNSQHGVHWYPRMLYGAAEYFLPRSVFAD